MNKNYSDKLNELVLTKGVCLKKGEKLCINTSPSCYSYAQSMAKRAYELGAKYVIININDGDLDSFRTLVQDSDEVSFVPDFYRYNAMERAKDNYVNVRLDSNEDRIGQTQGDSDKLAKLNMSFRKAGKVASDRYMSNELAWCVSCVPGPKWAKQLLGENATEDDLANVLGKILLFDNENYLSAWDEFDKKVKERREKLNSLNIVKLHYKSSITDFTISLTSDAHFEGGASICDDGKVFFPNLPTEELFTTPDMYSADGYITTTRPVNVLGQPTKAITFTFKEGRVVDVKAEEGLEIIKKYLAIDEGASRIGEVALVDNNSPISKTNLIFNSILIDENASCHIALGAGYPECVSGSSSAKTDEELHELKINTSLMHTDFMVGSSDLTITATTSDNKEVVIMENGSFTL